MKRDHPDVDLLNATAQLPADAKLIVDTLSTHVTGERLQRMQDVAHARTLRIAAVLDDVADPHNVAAVLRSAEAFGVHQVHLVEKNRPFAVSRAVTRGAHHWLNLQRHTSIQACAGVLHAQGFRLLVASMHGQQAVDEIQCDSPIAVILGNEHRGPDPAWNDHISGTYQIPMRGFVESLNVSVAAAVTFHALTRQATKVSVDQAQAILARWLMNQVSDAETIIARKLDQNSSR